jgi:hypothetical protein
VAASHLRSEQSAGARCSTQPVAFFKRTKIEGAVIMTSKHSKIPARYGRLRDGSSACRRRRWPVPGRSRRGLPRRSRRPPPIARVMPQAKGQSTDRKAKNLVPGAPETAGSTINYERMLERPQRAIGSYSISASAGSSDGQRSSARPASSRRLRSSTMVGGKNHKFEMGPAPRDLRVGERAACGSASGETSASRGRRCRLPLLTCGRRLRVRVGYLRSSARVASVLGRMSFGGTF